MTATIDDSTRYSGRVFWAIIAFAAAATGYGVKLDYRLERIEESLAVGTSDRWRASDTRRYYREAQASVDRWLDQLERTAEKEHPGLQLPRIVLPEPQTDQP